MKKIIQKTSLAGILSIVLLLAIGITALIETRPTELVLDKITSDKAEKIPFTELEAVMIEDTLFVPLRATCEKTGLQVDWDDERQAACVTLTASVDTPIGYYGAELLDKKRYTFPEKATINEIRVYIPTTSLNSTIIYNYKDTNGRNINLESTYTSEYGAKVNDDEVMFAPLRTIMECFSLDLNWDSKKSLRVSIPEEFRTEYEETLPALKASKATETPTKELTEKTDISRPKAPSHSSTQSPQTPGQYNVGDYIGKFKITHYCTCSVCNGGWGNNTAYGGAIRPGVTIAVDPSVIKKLAWVYIDGYGLRLAEDVGGGIRGHHIDMAVADHPTAMAMGVTYKDVWYAAMPDGE